MMMRVLKRAVPMLGATALAGGALVALAPGSAFAVVHCNQQTYARYGDLANGQGLISTVPGGTVHGNIADGFFLTGVVTPNTGITFELDHSDGAGVQYISTTNANGNCVVNDTDNRFRLPLVNDTIHMYVAYTPWEQNVPPVNRQFLGTIVVGTG